MAAADNAFAALLDDGTVLSWGLFNKGKIITLPAGKKVVSIASPFEKDIIH